MKENPFGGTEQQANRIAYLVAGFINKTITEPEHDELDEWVNASDNNMILFEELTDENNLAANLEWMNQVDTDRSFRELRERGAFTNTRKRSRAIWLAAAGIILLAALFFIFRDSFNSKQNKKDLADSDLTLQPGTDKAILTLGDGKTIVLGKDNTAMVMNDSSYAVHADSGKIAYTAGTVQATILHTLSTPVGGQYELRLSDGTVVWLNAETKLEFPVAFAGNERIVKLTGEAYFEVAHDLAKPFRVVLNDSATVTVLGTKFNITSYTDKATTEISLVEGSVRVNKGPDELKLIPGRQAVINGTVLTGKKIDNMESVTGWKNGNFVFSNAPIETIMQQLARWYGAEIIYLGKVPEHFNANISRKEPLSRILDLLEKTNHVHFKTENTTIYVLP